MTAPTSKLYRTGLLISVIALFLALFPMVGSDLGIFSMMVFFFLIPLTAVLLGLTALVMSILALRRLPPEDPALRKTIKNHSILSLILSAGAIIISGLLAFVTVWYFYFNIAPDTDPPGDLQVFFHGEPDQREIAIQSIFLPDSTLLTSGFHNPEGNRKGGSGMVMKTSLSGEKLALFDVPGTLGEIVISPNGVIINTRARPYPTDSTVKTKELALYKLDHTGAIVAEKTYPLGNEGGTGEIRPAVGGGFLLNGTFDWIDEDSTRQTSYVTRFTADLDTLWWKVYSSEYVGRLRNLAPTTDGGCLLLGMRDKPDGSKTVSDTLKLTRLDAEGNIVWSGVSIAVTSLSPSKACEIPDDGRLVVLCQRQREPDSVEGALYRLSAEGQIIWSKGISSAGYEVVTDFIPWGDGGWLIVGWAPRKEAKMRLSNKDMRVWDTYVIIEADSLGEVRNRYTGGYTQFAAWGVTRLDDNTAAITGFGSRGPETIHQRYGAQDIGIIIYRRE